MCYLFSVPAEILARGPLALEAYNEAVAEGSTPVMRVPIMVIGQWRSGKTSLKKSVKGVKFDEAEECTIVMERDPSHFSLSKELWSTGEKHGETISDFAVSDDTIAREVASRLRQKENQESRHHHFQEVGDTPIQLIERKPSSSTGPQLKDPEPKLLVPVEAGLTQLPQEELPVSGEKNDKEDVIESVPKEIEAGIEKHLVNLEDSQKVYSVIWDFAGQVVFYALHPIFLTMQAIYLLVYNLHWDPDEKARPVEHEGIYEQKEDKDCTKTNADYLDVWMSSVSCLSGLQPTEKAPEENGSEAPEGNLPEKLPPVFLVCTNADRPYDSSVGGNILARKIYGSLKKKPHGMHLVKDFFVVNNTKSGSADECPEVKRLREEILTIAEQLPHVKQDIPIKWLTFERELKSRKEKGQRCISLDDARKIARECQITDDKHTHVLNFLHDQRTIIYFDDSEVLKNLVVLDIDWLIDVFKNVITVKPYDPKAKKDEMLWEKLEEKSILDHALLEIVWKDVLGDETVESLIAIMTKFGLLSPWPSSESTKEYLVPSMLMSHPEEDAINLLASAHIPSLFLRFKQLRVPDIPGEELYVPVPLGFFPRLILKFLEWCTENESESSYPTLFKDFARFYVYPDERYSITLLQHSYVVELVVLEDVDVCDSSRGSEMRQITPCDVKICVSLQKKLEDILTRMNDDFCWFKSVEWELNVLCPVCCEGGSSKSRKKHSGRKHEKSLHFWSEAELCSNDQPICKKNPLATCRRVPLEKVKPWFGVCSCITCLNY